MPTNKEYRITTIKDLIQLDERQLDACLKDLKVWIKIRKVAAYLTSLTDEEVIKTNDYMHWVDDGIVGMTDINIHIKQLIKDA